jgi:hypothetical protein
LAIKIPVRIITILIMVTQVKRSPRICTASTLLNTGIRLLKRAVLVGPNRCIAPFQARNEITDVPKPRYRNTKNIEEFHSKEGTRFCSII